MADREKALVLTDEFAATSVAGEPVHFGTFPGRWVPGRPILVSDLGLDLADARERVRAGGLPLKEVNVDRARAMGVDEAREGENRAASGPMGLLERSVSPAPGLSADEYEAREAARAAARPSAGRAAGEAAPTSGDTSASGEGQ